MARFIFTLSATLLTATASLALPTPEHKAVDLMKAEDGVVTLSEVTIAPSLIVALTQGG